jgi:hypothetical protein
MKSTKPIHIPPHLPIFKNIAFFGDSQVKKTDPVYQDAYEIAKLISGEGLTIVNGGGPGVMTASTQGAAAVNGETLSVTFFPKDATGFEGKYVGNITTKEIRTTNYIERMFKLLEHADMFIIFKGGSGTISEFGTAWVLAKLYHGHHKPFILFGDFWIPIVDAIKDNMNISQDELDVFDIVVKKADIIPTIKRFEKNFKKIDHSRCKICAEKAFMN